MTDDALTTFTRQARATFGPLTTPMVAALRAALEGLARAPTDEPWLAALHRDAPASRELHRDPEHGYPSRVAVQSTRYEGDYDHLARLLEWMEQEDEF